jgi:ABC-type multidrug transport system permease subunit
MKGQQHQTNSVNSGNLYATQKGNINIGARQAGPRLDTKVLLATLLTDVVFFFYGMLSYTGHNTTGDEWRAGLFLFLFIATSGMFGRWVRRRM